MSSKAKNDCYKLIQVIAIAQDPICTMPGCWQPSQVGHHLFKRSNLATAFHPLSVRGFCHLHHGHAHTKPAEFEKAMIMLMGPLYHDLQRLSKQVVPDMDYVAKRTELRGILESFRKKVVNF